MTETESNDLAVALARSPEVRAWHIGMFAAAAWAEPMTAEIAKIAVSAILAIGLLAEENARLQTLAELSR